MFFICALEEVTKYDFFNLYLTNTFATLIYIESNKIKDKEDMFNVYYHLTINDDMLVRCAKLINGIGIEQMSPIIMQMTLQTILDKFLKTTE